MENELKENAILFLQYFMLENGMISEEFSEEELNLMEEEYDNFIKDKND